MTSYHVSVRSTDGVTIFDNVTGATSARQAGIACIQKVQNDRVDLPTEAVVTLHEGDEEGKRGFTLMKKLGTDDWYQR